MKITSAIATAQAQIVANALDGGMLRFYTGTKPATPETAITDQILLAECGINTPVGSVSDGVITFTPLVDDLNANNTGTVTWARLYGATDTPIADCSVGTTGDITTTATAWVAGIKIIVGSLSYTVEKGA